MKRSPRFGPWLCKRRLTRWELLCQLRHKGKSSWRGLDPEVTLPEPFLTLNFSSPESAPLRRKLQSSKSINSRQSEFKPSRFLPRYSQVWELQGGVGSPLAAFGGFIAAMRRTNPLLL